MDYLKAEYKIDIILSSLPHTNYSYAEFAGQPREVEHSSAPKKHFSYHTIPPA